MEDPSESRKAVIKQTKITVPMSAEWLIGKTKQQSRVSSAGPRNFVVKFCPFLGFKSYQ